MTRALRQRHRLIFMVLGLALPVAFGLGIAARRAAPVMNALPPSIAGTPQSGMQVWEREDLFTNAPIAVRLTQDAGRLAISTKAMADFVKPDLLVYWSSGGWRGGDAPPSDAVLLGAFNVPRLFLPAIAETTPGELILFSLADQKVVAVSRRIRFGQTAP
jgi:hypothetical protein